MLTSAETPTLPQLDFAAARDHMVDSQLRPNRIIDPRIIRAMRTLPRERFLPDAMASMAYIDEDIALDPGTKVGGRVLPTGRVLMEPLTLARLIQLARPRSGERALIVGSGTGYGAAVLAACGVAVTALEDDPSLITVARRVLPSLAPNVVIVEGRLSEGQPGPWDIILIQGAVNAIPSAIGRQLDHHGGRLVTVLAQSAGLGKGVLAEPINPGATDILLRAQPFFDCATPYLPSLQPAPTFKF